MSKNLILGLLVILTVFLIYFIKNQHEASYRADWDIQEVVTQLGNGIIDPGFEKFFNRDPERNIPQGKNIIVSPADGKVISIQNKNNAFIIRISLSLLDVHVQRIPISGRVVNVERVGSGFLPATQSGHLNNVQSITTLNTQIGKVVIKQITGFLARRIQTYVKPGDKVIIGKRLGRILLGSTVIIVLPDNANLTINENQIVTGGETIIAKY